MKPITSRRRRITTVAAVVLPVARRLARMEDLLLEMRHEQDIKLKRLNAIQQQLDALTEIVVASRRSIRHLEKRPHPQG